MNRPLLHWLTGLGMLLATAGPAQAIVIGFDPTPQTAIIGSSVDVGVVISDLGDQLSPSLSAFDLDISFDPGLLSFANVEFGDPVLGNQLDLFGLGSETEAGITSPGVLNLYQVSLDSPDELNALQAGSFRLATITFNAIGIGTSMLGISINVLGDADGNELLADTVTGGSVNSIPEPTSVALLVSGLLGLLLTRRTVR